VRFQDRRGQSLSTYRLWLYAQPLCESDRQTMIAVCQPLSNTARYHLLFDALMLRSICLAFPDEPILYMTDRANCNLMKEYLRDLSVNLRILEVGVPDNGARRLNLLGRLLMNLIVCRSMAEHLKVHCLVYLAFNTITCALHLTRLSQIAECYIVHNNFQRARQSPWERRLFRWIATRAPYLIFLEQPIADAARSEFAINPSKVIVIPHPINDVSQIINTADELGRGIVMAGRLNKGKGIHFLLDVACLLKKEAPEVLEKVPIKIIGPYYSGHDPKRYIDCVEHMDQQLTDADLEQVMRSGQFVIIPYEPESYAYVTPGTVYRALGCGRPIIVSDLPSLFPLTRGSRPVGFSFSHSYQLADIIKHIASMSEQEYKELLDNVRWLASQRGVLASSRRLKQALE
jgi:glycosyltransferase involved in cell wall biosynthesis